MANKIGWIVGFLLLAGIGGGIAMKLLVFPSQSVQSKETLEPGFSDLIEVDASPTSVLDAAPRAPGNAGDDYHKAVPLFRGLFKEIVRLRRPEINVKITKGREVVPGKTLEVLRKIHAHVAAGAKKKQMKYTFVHTPKEFQVGFFYLPAADNLQGISESLEVLLWHHLGLQEHARAVAVLQDAYVLGLHMAGERARVDMVQRGLRIQERALMGLDGVYSSWDQAKYAQKLRLIRKQVIAVQAARSRYSRKREIVWSTKPNPGDLYFIVANDKDPAFRVQALLALGVVRFTHADHRGDMKRTRELLDQYAASSNPLEAAAAKAAKNMTEEDFNDIWRR